MLCTNGHNNTDDARFCAVCGTNTFRAGSQIGVVQGQVPFTNAVTNNGLAIASMVLGICWVYWIGSILALIFGYVARGQIKRTHRKGDGMAIAGIVLGWVGIAGLVAVILVVIASHH